MAVMQISNSGDRVNTRQFLSRIGAATFVSAALGLGAQAAELSSFSETDASSSGQAFAPLNGAAQALRSEISATFGADSAVAQAYAARAFAPVWLTEDGKVGASARALVAALKGAPRHALPAAKYRGTELEAELASPTWALEARLTRFYLAYAQDVKSGILTPRKLDRELHVFPERPVASSLLQEAARATDMAAFLDALSPQGPGYRRLLARYEAFRSVAAQDIWGTPISQGRTLRPGDQHRRVPEVRRRLAALGDLDASTYDQQDNLAADGTLLATNEVTTDVPLPIFESTEFDQPMVEALRSFQARHGLNRDGVLGPATLAQLNISPQTRARQIAVNLERMRWMNRDLGERHILVNLAGFTMAVMNRGETEFTSRVVVGKARKHRTPEFSDEMTHMVINPSWYVPTSIAQEELLPKLAEDPDYLTTRGIRQLDSGRLVQRPGPGNALGTVKFMFPNQFAIYLHDTPAKSLFKRDVRAYSHGCIRVEKPHELAAHLLAAQRDDPVAYFDSVLQRGRERRVDLLDPLPVHITYRSAWIDDDGVEQFRGDIYKRDAKIAAALEETGVFFE